MKNFKHVFFVSLLVLCGLLSGVSLADSGFLNKIPLEWKPTKKVSDKINGLAEAKKEGRNIFSSDPELAGAKNVKFTVAPFTDLREKPVEIGGKVYSPQYTQKVTTKDNVAQWLTGRVVDVFGQLGMNADGTQPVTRNASLEADIVRFYTVEKTYGVSVYSADVELHWRLKSTDGHVLWEGTTSGEARRGGASYKAENYFETLSDATMEAVFNLMKTEAFLLALKDASSMAVSD